LAAHAGGPRNVRVNMHVTIRGDGPDLVLLHGWALNSACWDAFATRLADRYRVHAIDLPGHGRSVWSTECTGIDGLVLAIRRHVPAGAFVVGWSLGGMVALRLAQLASSAVARLVLLATTPRFTAGADWHPGMPVAEFEQFAQRVTHDHDRTVGEFLSLQVRGEAQPQTVLRQLKRSLNAGGRAQAVALDAGLEILRTTDLRRALPAIEQPALVIAGTYDRLTRLEAARFLARSLANGRLTAIDRAGHAMFLSHPDQVLDAVETFLSPVQSAAAHGMQR
jgi:pimeloyl-[acyl-carrier protein] methyl ester esterase